MLSADPDRVVDHAPPHCPCCRIALSPDLACEEVSVPYFRTVLRLRLADEVSSDLMLEESGEFISNSALLTAAVVGGEHC